MLPWMCSWMWCWHFNSLKQFQRGYGSGHNNSFCSLFRVYLKSRHNVIPAIPGDSCTSSNRESEKDWHSINSTRSMKQAVWLVVSIMPWAIVLHWSSIQNGYLHGMALIFNGIYSSCMSCNSSVMLQHPRSNKESACFIACQTRAFSIYALANLYLFF